MARARNIKPGFYKNEELAECSVWARLIFPGLWMLADREGRLEDRPKKIKGELLPFDPKDIDPLLIELEAKKFILRYQNDEGRFIQILKFNQHQSPHYSEKPSVIKPPQLSEFTPLDAPPKPEKRPPIKRGSQPPDSLIPDSLIPETIPETTPAVVTKITAPEKPAAGVVDSFDEPDPKLVAALDDLRVAAGVGTDDHAKAGELHHVLAANSVKCNAAHPKIIDWVRQRVTVAEIRQAIAEARRSTDGPLNPGYLATIIARLRSETPKNGKSAAWATDDKACEIKARELGLWPAKTGETYDGLRNRIRAKLTKQAEESVR